ncbi:MAG: histidinol-phosphate transaminase [Pseudonocardiaceae bacterium]|nr:histidinol-phosphate transaminase [Pseudonocardiaceae bacterium]
MSAPITKPDTRTPACPVSYALSTNENPYRPLRSVRRAVRAESGRLNRYPDPSCAELTARLAERFHVPAEHIVVGPGSIGVVQQLLRARASAGEEVVYAWRSFEGYPIITQIAGARSVPVPLAHPEVHDLDAMAGAITNHTRLVFVCNPNNPTGTVLRRTALRRFLDRVPPDVPVVLDEAYREFVRDPDTPDGVELYGDYPNLVVLRTFSKAYGLAGLRVGFAIAHESIAAAMGSYTVPFGVTALAQAAAIASLHAESELLDRVEALVEERRRVLNGLRDIGCPVPGSEANFLWLPLGEQTVEFATACGGEGLIVRPYPGEGVRITIGDPASNDRVLRVAAEYFSSSRP